MFEHRQDQVQEMLNNSDEFRAIYNRHQRPDQKGTAAEAGNEPIDDVTLAQLKKKKLLAKDQLARILGSGSA